MIYKTEIIAVRFDEVEATTVDEARNIAYDIARDVGEPWMIQQIEVEPTFKYTPFIKSVTNENHL